MKIIHARIPNMTISYVNILNVKILNVITECDYLKFQDFNCDNFIGENFKIHSKVEQIWRLQQLSCPSTIGHYYKGDWPAGGGRQFVTPIGHRHIRPHLATFGHIWPHLATFGHIWPH